MYKKGESRVRPAPSFTRRSKNGTPVRLYSKWSRADGSLFDALYSRSCDALFQSNSLDGTSKMGLSSNLFSLSSLTYKVYSSSSRQLFTEKRWWTSCPVKKGTLFLNLCSGIYILIPPKYWTHFLRRKEIFFPPLKMDGVQRRPACVLSISFHFRTTLDEWASSYSPRAAIIFAIATHQQVIEEERKPFFSRLPLLSCFVSSLFL